MDGCSAAPQNVSYVEAETRLKILYLFLDRAGSWQLFFAGVEMKKRRERGDERRHFKDIEMM